MGDFLVFLAFLSSVFVVSRESSVCDVSVGECGAEVVDALLIAPAEVVILRGGDLDAW
jgi:hypothetical protein